MVLLIDNYGSFTYNLYQYIGEIYKKVKVVRNDSVTVEEVIKLSPKRIVLSSGPGRPEDTGVCVQLVKEIKGKVPILGVGLGSKIIGLAYGCNIYYDKAITHGKASIVLHNGKGIFSRVKNPIRAAVYSSLRLDRNTLPEELEITARTLDGTIMAVSHRHHPVYGMEFHPESILTEEGKRIISNFTGEI